MFRGLDQRMRSQNLPGCRVIMRHVVERHVERLDGGALGERAQDAPVPCVVHHSETGETGLLVLDFHGHGAAFQHQRERFDFRFSGRSLCK